MIMQESSCVILILRIFRVIKLRILVLRCPGNTIFGVLEALKFKIYRCSAPAPLRGGGLRHPPNPPGVSSLASLGRKDTLLRSDPPPLPNSTTLASWLTDRRRNKVGVPIMRRKLTANNNTKYLLANLYSD